MPVSAAMPSRHPYLFTPVLAALSLIGIGLSPLRAAAPYLVKDINPASGNTGSNPVEILAAGDVAYFVAGDSVNGYQVRQTDGTAAGTRLIKPQGENVAVNVAPNGMASIGSTIFYSSGGLSSELWKTDGTAEGTMLVKDLNSVTGSSPVRMTPMNGVMYFVANESTRGIELYRSDGTVAGTTILKDINPGSGSSIPHELTVVGNTLYFLADDGVNGEELWKSDGTAAGTVLVKAIAPISSLQVPVSLTAFGNKVYFIADDGNRGTELWASDGTAAGTDVVKDINTGSTSSLPTGSAVGLMVAGDAIYFRAYSPGAGTELWKSDGSAAGTMMVKDIGANTASSYPNLLGAVGSRLFFGTTTGMMGAGWDFWVTDGTAAGTTVLPDIIPEAGITAANCEASGNLLYLSTTDGSSGVELWRSDGSAAGTFRVADIRTGSASSTPSVLTAFRDGILFAADDGVHGVELWKSDGTAAGTMMVRDVDTAPASGLGTNDWVVMGGLLYFAANDGVNGSELWRSDGTAAGTAMVAQINPGSANASPTDLTVVGDTLYFMATSPGIGKELWKSDGSSAGTVLVKDLTMGSSSTSVSYFLAYQGKLYFYRNGISDSGLWRSDGTAAGTVLVKDSTGDLGSMYAGSLAAGDYFWFAGTSATTYGTELWRSDGTTIGTRMVQDSATGLGSSIPRGLTQVGNYYCYFAETPTLGVELWRTDGNSSSVLKDIRSGINSSIGNFSVAGVGNTMFFTADDGTNGNELWATDGTAANTRLVKDTLSGSTAGNPTQFMVHAGQLYFTASTPTFGLAEMWKTDGTSSGTVKVRQTSLGGPRNANYLVTTPERLYFRAKEADDGPEHFWRSDGSSAGTMPLSKQLPGQSMGARLDRVQATQDKIFMRVLNVENGRELWAIDLNPRIALEMAQGQVLPSTGARLDWNPDSAVPDPRAIVIRNDGEKQLQGLQVTMEPANAQGYQLSTTGMATSLAAEGTTSFTISRVGQVGSAPVILRVSSSNQAIAPVEVTLLPWVNIPVPSWDGATLLYNPQTGAYEFVVTLLNPGAHTLSNFAIMVVNLPPGMTLRGDTVFGSLLADVGPLAPGASAAMTLRFDLAPGSPAPDPATFAPDISMLPALPSLPGTQAFVIDQIERTPTGGVTLGFPSVQGHRYRVEYSADSKQWTAVTELIEASGTRAQWTDEGPPRTATVPGETRKRFYRIVEVE